MKSKKNLFLYSLLYLLCLNGCIQKQSIVGGVSAPTQLSSTINSIDLKVTQTPLLSDGHIPTKPPRKTPDPIQFYLPTPGTQPVIYWRPPLYPVPWALSPFDHFYFTLPVTADQINWPTPDYRYGGIFFKPEAVHTGVDIPALQGTPVLASGQGEVVWAGWGLYTKDPTNKSDPYGLAVVLQHDFGYHDQSLFTVYAHLDRVDVVTGEWVKTGESLGLVGETGFTTGPHLHFEVRLGENSYFNTTNPELWLVPPQGWGVLAARITDSYNNVLPDWEVTLVSDESEQEWVLRSYPSVGVSGDQYYQENLVMSDLPGGTYTFSFFFHQKKQELKIQILPGQVTYFYFRGLYGFRSLPPIALENGFYPDLIP